MALPRIINGQMKQLRSYGDLKHGHTFTLVETLDVSLVWQKTSLPSSEGNPVSVKLSTGETAGFKPDMPVYPFSIDISATPAV